MATFNEMSRVLAGFPDGRGGEGVGAGEATLVGVRLARRNGWAAPEQPEARKPGARAATRAQRAPVKPVPGGEQSSVDTPAAPPEGGTADTATGREPSEEA